MPDGQMELEVDGRVVDTSGTAIETSLLCRFCGEEYDPVTEGVEYNDKFYHNDCMFRCAGCHRNRTIPRLAETVGGNHYCGDCVSDCVYCGDTLYGQISRYTDTNGDRICAACWDSNYTMCEDCEEVICQDEVYYDEYSGNNYCESCWDALGRSSCGQYDIADCDFKPTYTFLGGKRNRDLMLGPELEFDGANDVKGLARRLRETNSKIWCKGDGSLSNDGAEICTQPATLAYHMNHMGWGRILTTCRDFEATSHNNGRCGLHIHIDRRYFNCKNRNIPEIRIATIFSDFWTPLHTLSRRGNDLQYAHKVGKEHTRTRAHFRALQSGGKYMAVNVSERHTIEIRLMRGTLNPLTFFATFELIAGLAMYARNHTVIQIKKTTWGNLINWVLQATGAVYLPDYLELHGLHPHQGRYTEPTPEVYRGPTDKNQFGQCTCRTCMDWRTLDDAERRTRLKLKKQQANRR